MKEGAAVIMFLSREVEQINVEPWDTNLPTRRSDVVTSVQKPRVEPSHPVEDKGDTSAPSIPMIGQGLKESGVSSRPVKSCRTKSFDSLEIQDPVPVEGRPFLRFYRRRTASNPLER